MLHKQKSLARLVITGLAVATLAPATAGAVPIIDGNTVHTGTSQSVTPQTLTAPDQVDRNLESRTVVGQGVAAGGGPGVTPDTLTAPTQDLRAPDQVNPGVPQTPSNVPQWPLNPQPITGTKANPTAAKPADDGLGTEAIVLIVVGGLVVLATAGLGIAARQKRAKAGRQRELA
jgi:hypothetical protein